MPSSLIEDLIAYVIYSNVTKRETLEEEFGFLLRRGAISREEFDKLCEEVRGRAEEVRGVLGKRIAETISEASGPIARALDLPTKTEVDALRRRVEDLEARLREKEA